MNNKFILPDSSPERIFTLRDSSFAADLFFTSVGHLDLFNRLEKTPSDIEGICLSTGIKSRPADVMLTLLKAYGFIREENGNFSITDVARDYLISDSFFDLSSYVATLVNRPICDEMLRVLKTGEPANWAAAKEGKQWAEMMEDEESARSFTAGMNSRGAYLAAGILKVIDLSGCRNLLDIGGASGIYAAAFLQEYPDLRAAVFEKPPVDQVALFSLAELGVNDRAGVVAGDMFTESLPKGYDVHFLSHVLHDWDIDKVKAILVNSYENLEPGGKLILHDAHVNEDKTGPVSVAEYSVLLMFLSQGKCYSIREMRDVLTGIGFRNIEYRPTILNRSIITAEK
ncbi:MAG: hypothetical protein JW712_00475 [Dehalococcoidales bacterium]|nr:hypothetical protein [Dehalococcoidales bacterium]